MTPRSICLVTALACLPALALAQSSDADVADWTAETAIDKLDGKRTLQALALARLGGMKAEIVASCHPGAVAVRFTVSDLLGRGVPLKISTTAEGEEVIRMRSRLDSDPATTTLWPPQYTNEAGVLLHDRKDKMGFFDYYGETFGKGTPEENREAMRRLLGAGALVDMFTGGSLADTLLKQISAGPADRLGLNRVLKVELPLADGRAPVIALKLDGDAFRKFASECPASASRSAAASPPAPAPAPAARPPSPTPDVPKQQATAPATSAYEQGAADRRAWEQWFAGLSGTYKDGAFYWSGQRSLPKPGACVQPGIADPDFEAGCEAAKKRLARSDERRKAEADYKRGWNSI